MSQFQAMMTVLDQRRKFPGQQLVSCVFDHKRIINYESITFTLKRSFVVFNSQSVLFNIFQSCYYCLKIMVLQNKLEGEISFPQYVSSKALKLIKIMSKPSLRHQELQNVITVANFSLRFFLQKSILKMLKTCNLEKNIHYLFPKLPILISTDLIL